MDGRQETGDEERETGDWCQGLKDRRLGPGDGRQGTGYSRIYNALNLKARYNKSEKNLYEFFTIKSTLYSKHKK